MNKQKALIKQKKYDNGLAVVKYDRKVFYDNLWHTDPELMESRGKVIFNDVEIVALPFKKIFNYKENDTFCELDKLVIGVEKINGFMFHVTEAPDNDDLRNSLGCNFIKGTTGSLDSDFVKLANENIKKHCVNIEKIAVVNKEYGGSYTYIFEIKDNEKDPHIINEKTEADGVYLLGARNIKTGQLLKQSDLDDIAKIINAKRPVWLMHTFETILNYSKKVNHEGFVIYNILNHDAILKLKSPFYTIKKWFMRRNNDFVFRANYKQLVDEEYYDVIKKIRSTYNEETWKALTEQEKGVVFEELMYGETIED